ncbi:MAG TPA: hypothetical protein VD861_00230 [Pyrinomonadaceae bacterium]|nr:hypothetical protein [Pyrinomonadaceae bacterium]
MTLAAVVCAFVAPFSAAAQVATFTPECDGADDTARFTALISSIGPNTGTIRLPYRAGSRCAVNNLTVPANVTLDNSDGTGVRVNTGQTLTLLGPLVNPAGKRFFYNALEGQGTVSLVGNTKVKAVHVGWWGAVADSGTTDNTAHFQAALTCAGTAKGIDVEFDNTAGGHYSFSGQLSLTGLAQMTLRGAGSGRQGGGAGGNIPNSARTELRYTGKGTDSAIVGAPARAVTFEGLAIRYSSPTFTGDLISFDNPGTTGDISAQNRIQECLLGGSSATAVNARSLVLFRNNVEGGVRDSVLMNAVRGVIGRGTLADGTSGASTAFSNAILIHNNRFQFLSGYAIVNPGVQWEITGNVFEPGRDMKGRAITTEDAEVNGRYANSLGHKGITITGNGFWDSTGGGTWIAIRGSGYYIAGNFVTLYNNGARVDGKFVKLYGDAANGTHGVVITGNAFAGRVTGGGNSFEGLYVDASDATVVSNVVFQGNGGENIAIPPPPDIRYGPAALSSFQFNTATRTAATRPNIIGRDEGFVFLDASSGAFTNRLPDDATFGYMKGRAICMLKIDASRNAATITGRNGTETINGAPSYIFNRPGQSACFISSDGTNWMTFGEGVAPDSFAHAAAADSFSNTAALDFGLIAANTTAELTIAVSGATPGMSVQVSPEGAPEAGLLWSGYVSGEGSVTVRLGNVTTLPIDPAARTWRATVTK